MTCRRNNLLLFYANRSLFNAWFEMVYRSLFRVNSLKKKKQELNEDFISIFYRLRTDFSMVLNFSMVWRSTNADFKQTWSLDRPCISEEIAEALGISNLQAALDNQEYLDVTIPLEDEMLDLTEGSNTFFSITYRYSPVTFRHNTVFSDN